MSKPPSPARLRAACRGHGFAAESIEPMANTGLANWVFALDSAHVLRVARPTAVAEADAYTESVAVPAAVAAGIATPALLVFDDSRSHLDTPFTIYDRVPGAPVGLTELPPEKLAAVYTATGREMARIHDRITACEDPHGRLDRPECSPAWSHLEAARAAGAISAGDARWIERLLGEIEPALATTPQPRFLHGDVLPMNIMVHRDRFEAIIDWGDAGWAEPGCDFWGILPHLDEHAFTGYQAEAPLDPSAVARALWEQASRALRHLVETERRPIAVELLGQLHAYVDSPPGRRRLGALG